jgi:hypothetical protein
MSGCLLWANSSRQLELRDCHHQEAATIPKLPLAEAFAGSSAFRLRAGGKQMQHRLYHRYKVFQTNRTNQY